MSIINRNLEPDEDGFYKVMLGQVRKGSEKAFEDWVKGTNQNPKFGEYGHPNILYGKLDERISRCTSIDHRNIGFKITTANIVEDNILGQIVYGYIKPCGPMAEHVIKQLETDKICFGMRSLEKLGIDENEVIEVITYDLISDAKVEIDPDTGKDVTTI